MGMIIVFLWGLYALAVMAVVILVAKFITPNHKVKIAIIIFGILLATYDIIITNVLGAYYCSQEPNPKTLIKNKVEYPLSIYWEDNVYPGFNAEDRKLMITNYLDGKHLKTMALNGDDGKIYIYETNASVWEKLKQLEKERGQPYYDMVNTIAQHIMETSEDVYTKETMPKMNYTVTMDEVKLNLLSRKFLYSDETKIIYNQTGESIAYNRWYMPFFYNITPDFVLGNRYYSSWGWEICQQRNEYLERETFDTYKWTNWSFGHHKIDTNIKLYNKHIKGEK